MRIAATVLALGLLVPASIAPAQEKDQEKDQEKKAAENKTRPSVLDLERVAKRPIWCDLSPRLLGWSADGKTFYYSHAARDENALMPVYAFDLKSGQARKLTPRQVWAKPPSLFAGLGTARRDRGGYARDRMSPDRRRVVFTRGGDVFLREVKTGKERRLTWTREAESGAVFSGDGRRIFFVRGADLFALDLEDRRLRQRIHVQPGPKPKPKKPEAAAKTALEKFLFEQQKALFTWVKKRRARRRAREKQRTERKTFDKEAVKTFYTPDGSSPTLVAVSPSGRYAVLRLRKRSASGGGGKRTVVPTYVTESGFVETRPSRPKVGEPQTESRCAILDLENNEMKRLDPEPLRQARPSWIAFRWSPDGKTLAALALAGDYRTRWVLSIDPATARAEVVDAWHDPAWIGGPAWRRFGWMKDSQRIWFISEATGYAHLYVADRTGRFRRQLTEGRWEVQNVRLDWSRERFQLITSEKHPGERHLYVMPAGGGVRRCLTGRFPGIDDAAFSPDGRHIVVKHSTPTMPASLTLLDAGDRKGKPKVVRRIFRGATDAYLAGTWIAPRIVDFPDKHGNRVYARLYVPEKPLKRRAAVIHVHGAGYAQHAHKRWQSRPHTYLFLQYLVRKGYHVLDLDYRGSAGYGRDCRTEIYRYLGGTEVDSGEAAIDYLARTCGVDRKRVGLFGGSYGGFYTLMALFTRPGLFRVGVALYPVADWAHYNAWYTSRILNLPQEDRDAYRRSSPIFLARNLKDRLQIQHGVADTNVHFQDTMRLVQRLVELKKTGWDVVTYPVEGHGWRTETSRLDSFRRMDKLFDETLRAPGLE